MGGLEWSGPNSLLEISGAEKLKKMCESVELSLVGIPTQGNRVCVRETNLIVGAGCILLGARQNKDEF